MVKMLLLSMALLMVAVGLAKAAGNNARIVGEWHCTSDDLPPDTFALTAHKTWSDTLGQKGTYVYDDDTRKLQLLEPNGFVSAFGSDQPPLVWISNSHFTWTAKRIYTEHFMYDCKKKS